MNASNAAMSSTAATSAMRGRSFRFNPKWLVHITLFVLAVIWLVPTVGLLITSFRTREAIADSGWWTAFTPARFTFDNYTEVLNAQGMGQGFLNSFMITLPSTFFPLIIAALAAYAFSWLKFWSSDFIFLILMALLVVPIQTALVPALQLVNLVTPLFNSLGIDPRYISFIRIWIVHTAFGLPFAIYLLRNFFSSIPRELLESARIDGAGDLTIFGRMILPLSVPALASLGIFQFMWVWNDLLMALVFMNNPETQPVTVRMQAMLGTYASEWDIMSASAFISMVVPLMVFFALQRYFVVGLTAGAVKS
ncbi:MAG: carbohydrate ABC transporter permease [Anaerolineae bacterium]